MPKKLSFKLTATSLRLVLLASLAIIILLQIGLIVLSQHLLTGYSHQVASAVSVSSSDEKTLQDLENVNKILQADTKTVKKAQGITADNSNTYAYQNKIIQDLASYGQKSGINITGWAFSDETTPATGTAASTSATTKAASKGAAAPSGVTPVTVTVSLAPGITYKSLYTFLQLLEGNLLRMEVQGLNLSRPAEKTDNAPGGVPLSTLTIQVYTRK